MDERVLRKVDREFRARYYSANDIWLRECVECYLSEHNNPSDLEVLEFAISQWQLSDLREISNERPCLPSNLARQKCTTLQGNLILQMEKVYDIATSKYKQLEKIRNVSTENIQVTEAEATQAWQPKKNRMLQFHFTDGAQDITAIEYKPIRISIDKLLPGYKLMIKGPVTCRRGVILLEASSLVEIGGEVETLLVKNAPENILARALNLPENPDPYNDEVNKNPAKEEVDFDDDFDIDLDAVDLIERNSQEESKKMPLLNHREAKSSSASSRERTVTIPPRPPPNQGRPPDPVFDRIDEEDIEDDWKPIPAAQNIKKPVSKNPVNKFPPESEFPEVGEEFDDWNIDPAPRQRVQEPLKKTPVRKVPMQSEFPEDGEEFEDWNVEPEPRKKAKEPLHKIAVRKLPMESEFPEDGEFDDWEVDPAPRQRAKEPLCKTPVRVLPRETEFPDEDDLILIPDDSAFSETAGRTGSSERSVPRPEDTFGSSSSESSSRAPGKKSTPLTKTKRPASVLSPQVHQQPAGKIRCVQNTPKSKQPVNRKITDFLKKGEASEKICDNVSDILNARSSDGVVRKTVRGRLEKFDKLGINGDCWEFNGTISDATGSVNVAFLSKILEKMLGFTVAEFKQKKKLKKTNPEIESELRQALRSTENKIRNLDALLDIEQVPGQKPKVVKIRDITEEQRKILDRRALFDK